MLMRDMPISSRWMEETEEEEEEEVVADPLVRRVVRRDRFSSLSFFSVRESGAPVGKRSGLASRLVFSTSRSTMSIVLGFECGYRKGQGLIGRMSVDWGLRGAGELARSSISSISRVDAFAETEGAAPMVLEAAHVHGKT